MNAPHQLDVPMVVVQNEILTLFSNFFRFALLIFNENDLELQMQIVCVCVYVHTVYCAVCTHSHSKLPIRNEKFMKYTHT